MKRPWRSKPSGERYRGSGGDGAITPPPRANLHSSSCRSASSSGMNTPFLENTERVAEPRGAAEQGFHLPVDKPASDSRREDLPAITNEHVLCLESS